ncbi:MAG: NADH-quinone oxidoreductase subunit H, partial [Bdellovibrionales bacterium]|nr:NADH-quinone oxidoreductase subunit H [Bdellovibrionales bacterium]
ISYEITMGVSIVGILAIYGTLDLSEITRYQAGTFLGVLPNWGVFLNPIGFVIFFISMMAETKRAPFDLPESESELVAGYLTEYSGMKFLLYWLGEFAEIVVASAMVVLLFFGGWQLPYVDVTAISSDWGGILPSVFRDWNFQWAPLIGAAVFGAKTALFCVIQVVLRWTLPRFRYDQLMNFCWKIMLPVALANLVGTVILLLWGVYS